MKGSKKGSHVNTTARNPKGSSESYRKGAPTGGGPGPYPIQKMPKTFGAGHFKGMKP